MNQQRVTHHSLVTTPGVPFGELIVNWKTSFGHHSGHIFLTSTMPDGINFLFRDHWLYTTSYGVAVAKAVEPSIPLHVEVSLGKMLNPKNCSWFAGQHLAWQPPSSVYGCIKFQSVCWSDSCSPHDKPFCFLSDPGGFNHNWCISTNTKCQYVVCSVQHYRTVNCNEHCSLCGPPADL